jgi:hypothetical protein
MQLCNDWILMSKHVKVRWLMSPIFKYLSWRGLTDKFNFFPLSGFHKNKTRSTLFSYRVASSEKQLCAQCKIMHRLFVIT